MDLSTEDFHRLFEAMEQLLAEPEGARIKPAKTMEAQFGNAGEFILAALKLRGMPFTHRVVLVHGIRDDGAWFKLTGEELHGAGLLRTVLGGYGYFHVLRFLIPWARKSAYETVVQTLRDAQGPLCAVSVVCHSFGTYCVTKAILENADIRLFRLIMCGGIVDRKYPWNKVPSGLPVGRIMNECGNKDNWPIIANRISTKFGDTGRFGFGRDPVRDRWHDVGHDGFFTDELIRTHWLPFLTSGTRVESQIKSREPNWLFRAIAGRLP